MVIALLLSAALAADPVMLTYAEPAPVVDLGVGLWATPLPLDWDRDGDLDLVVSCTDKPYNGMWFFENPGDSGPFPVFKPGVKVAPGMKDVQVSYVNGEPRVLVENVEYVNFRESAFTETRELCNKALLDMPKGRTRAKDWKLADYDGDGDHDLIVGIDYWEDYGWDDGYDAQGNWLKGPLRGKVYLIRNNGTDATPDFQPSVQLHTTDGTPVETFGKPVPNLADYDRDGDLDLICGEFVDTFTYFENTGTRSEPAYAPGRTLTYSPIQEIDTKKSGALLPVKRRPLTMDLCMIVPVAMDWDGDGRVDLIVGDEDGRVAWIQNRGQIFVGGPLEFFAPKYFHQRGGPVKFGALATPHAVDWDKDGDVDILCGNTAGQIAWFENTASSGPPQLLPPRLLTEYGKPIRIMAGPNGSIQGPAERKWGYTVLTTADWDGDGNTDLIVNSIWGKVHWYRNRTGPGATDLDTAQSVRVSWDGATPRPAWIWWEPFVTGLATQWRTTPHAIDWNRDGLVDLVMLDPEGYLAFYERYRDAEGLLVLRPPARIFTGADGQPLRLNDKERGKSGRRKFTLADWDGDGAVDLLLNSVSANLWRNTSADPIGAPRFEDQGPLTPAKLEGHDTCPTVADWNKDGKLELLIGAEDGHFYYLP